MYLHRCVKFVYIHIHTLQGTGISQRRQEKTSSKHAEGVAVLNPAHQLGSAGMLGLNCLTDCDYASNAFKIGVPPHKSNILTPYFRYVFYYCYIYTYLKGWRIHFGAWFIHKIWPTTSITVKPGHFVCCFLLWDEVPQGKLVISSLALPWRIFLNELVRNLVPSKTPKTESISFTLWNLQIMDFLCQPSLIGPSPPN